MNPPAPALADLRAAWRAAWPAALSLWSDYLRLAEPRWCLTAAEAQAAGLTASFAMIRLDHHEVVINLEEVAARGLGGFPREVMGHEIGHHVLCPGDLADQGRLLARLRRALADRLQEAPLVANLYADLLINDRLQREARLDMAGIYRHLSEAAGKESPSRLWALYLRICELLWQRPRGDLVAYDFPVEMEGDALLGARHLRVYAREWLKGASGFGLLLYPYLDREEADLTRLILEGWLDTAGGVADEPPDGLAELDEEEERAPLHPADDPAVSGRESELPKRSEQDGTEGGGGSRSDRTDGGGRTGGRRYREVWEYGQLLRQLGVSLDAGETAMRYYRERALPHLVPFPEQPAPRASEPLREGFEPWEMGEPLAAIDWLETFTRHGQAIPGVTTLQPVYGEVPGAEPRLDPVDLYLGIDCSGSMPNPRGSLSYPVLAGSVVALSALRAGARVMACLSGEPGASIATDGFVRSERAVLALLTDYLGSGYSYGMRRLADLAPLIGPGARPVHLLILTDTDIFSSLEEGNHWEIAGRTLTAARGGGTLVLHSSDRQLKPFDAGRKRLTEQGWRLVQVTDWPGLLGFARLFARQNYGRRRA